MKATTKTFLLILATIIVFILIVLIMVLSTSDTPLDTACKSIGYDTMARSGAQYYCVNETDSIKVAFKNCGFKTCEVYKIK